MLMMLAAGSAFARSFDTVYEPEGLDELTKRKGAFKTTLVRPDADFSRYTKLNARKVMLVVRDPGPAAEQMETGSLIGTRKRSGVLPPFEALAELKEIVNGAITEELGAAGGFEVVSASDPETLVLRASLTDVVIDESSKIKTATGEPSFVVTQGTIVFDLIDGETGVIQMRVGERRKVRPPKGSSSAELTGPWPHVDHWIEDAAADLCKEIDRLRG
jgi:hypothetical protein